MAKKDLPKISDAEWKVMDVLWLDSPRSALEIIELLDVKDWDPKTVKTLLFRLVKKGVINHKVRQREYLYYPLIDKSEYLKKESQSFLDKLFDGATAPMVAHFIKSKKMDKKEIEAIKKILEDLDA